MITIFVREALDIKTSAMPDACIDADKNLDKEKYSWTICHKIFSFVKTDNGI